MDSSRSGNRLEAWRIKLSDDGDATAGDAPSASASASASAPASVEKAVSVEARCSQMVVMLRNSLRVPIVELGAQELRLGMGSQAPGVDTGAHTIVVRAQELRQELGLQAPGVDEKGALHPPPTPTHSHPHTLDAPCCSRSFMLVSARTHTCPSIPHPHFTPPPQV